MTDSQGIRIAVLASGRGTNLQAIIDATESGYIPGRVIVVISDKRDAYALERARKHGIEALFLDPSSCNSRDEYDKLLGDEIEKRGADLICLAGFMRILSHSFVSRFRNRIMNIHPALLPSFGGVGMYGERVHKAVLDYGVKITGCTVHFVTEEVDGGPIILQEAVPVLDDDTPETLAGRVLEHEHRIYPEAIKLFAEGRLEVVGRRVRIRGDKG